MKDSRLEAKGKIWDQTWQALYTSINRQILLPIENSQHKFCKIYVIFKISQTINNLEVERIYARISGQVGQDE